MKYREYLRTTQWQEIRKKVFERALKNSKSNNKYGVCESCGYVPYKACLQVHHKTYAGEMNRLDNLILLCPNCHKKQHGKHVQMDIKEKVRNVKRMQEKNIEFEVKKSIGVLYDTGTHVNKELNLVSWNYADAVFDLRSWRTNADGVKKPLKGLTLTVEEVKRLRELLNNIVEANN